MGVYASVECEETDEGTVVEIAERARQLGSLKLRVPAACLPYIYESCSAKAMQILKSAPARPRARTCTHVRVHTCTHARMQDSLKRQLQAGVNGLLDREGKAGVVEQMRDLILPEVDLPMLEESEISQVLLRVLGVIIST